MLDGETLAGLRDSFHGPEAGLQREEKYHQVHDPERKTLWRRAANTIGVLIHLETHEDSLVLEHVNGNHYHGMALKGVAPDRLPPCLAKAKEALASRRAHHLASLNPRLDPNHRP